MSKVVFFRPLALQVPVVCKLGESVSGQVLHVPWKWGSCVLDETSTHPKVGSGRLSLSVFQQLSKQAFAFKRKKKKSIPAMSQNSSNQLLFCSEEGVCWLWPAWHSLGPPSSAWVCLHGVEGQGY